jgi:hypothetical protein
LRPYYSSSMKVFVFMLKAWLLAGWGGPPLPATVGCPAPGYLGLTGLVAEFATFPVGLWRLGALRLVTDCCSMIIFVKLSNILSLILIICSATVTIFLKVSLNPIDSSLEF